MSRLGAEWVIQPVSMLCRCLDQLQEDPAERHRAYEFLCAIAPDKAFELEPK